MPKRFSTSLIYITKSVLIVSIMLALGSCGSKSEKSALIKIEKVFNVKSSSVEHQEVIDNLGKEIRLIELRLNFEKLNLNYKKQKITSSAALLFYNEIKNLDYKKSDSIIISLNASNLNYKKSYQFENIWLADSVIKEMFLFINAIQFGDFTKITNLIDTSKISISNLAQTRNLLLELESKYGKTTKLTSTGFSFNYSNEINKPILILWMEINNGEKITFCTFYFDIEYQKIIYYNFDSKEEG